MELTGAKNLSNLFKGERGSLRRTATESQELFKRAMTVLNRTTTRRCLPGAFNTAYTRLILSSPGWYLFGVMLSHHVRVSVNFYKL